MSNEIVFAKHLKANVLPNSIHAKQKWHHILESGLGLHF